MKTEKKDIRRCKLGLFVHYVLSGCYYADGKIPDDINDAVDNFDVEAFADSVAAMGVEYLLITAWHARVQPLYPSAVTEKWRPGNSPNRDLLGEILDSMDARNIPVMFYTHPRDGHDFSEEDKTKTGWGAGKDPEDDQHPNEATFDYDLWNSYMLEMFEELADRYASRIVGFYNDGNGSKDPRDLFHTNKDFQIVNYLKIRDILKSRNPDLISFQNYYGDAYGNDFGNSETYTRYIMEYAGPDNLGKWQCSAKTSTSLLTFATGWAAGHCNQEHNVIIPTENAIRFIMFNASVTQCGGILLSSGPFAEGGLWPAEVMENCSAVGKALARYPDSLLDARPSLSYPTISGTTLEDNHYRFWMTGEDNHYEYLHCLKLPENGVLEWSLPEDQILLSNPTVMSGDIRITEFVKSADGYTLRFTGTPDILNTVIRFTRIGVSVPCGYEWVNNSDTRICYHKDWEYTASWVYKKIQVTDGCFERDAHRATGTDSSAYFAFTGNIIEVYGVLGNGNGAADVFIDGVFCGTIDEQAEEDKARALCFTSIPLHGGQHVIQLYTKNDKPFYLDAFRVLC